MVGVGYALQALADFLAGEHCHACARPVDAVRALSPPSHPASRALAAPVSIGRGYSRIETHPLCRPCCHRLHPMRETVRVGALQLRVWAAFETDDRVLALVHALKFARRERLAPWLATAMSAGLPAASTPEEGKAIVVAVPADAASLRRRGFNQAECIARAFAAQVGMDFVAHALAKTRATVPQSTLDGAARTRNVAGAFAVARNAAIRDRCVIVVDDLVTTGATAGACAAALYAAGAREVRVAGLGYRP